MDKEKEVKKTHKLVKDILEKYPKTRNSDTFLYKKVAERINKDCLDKPFAYVLLHLEDYGLPPFETVRRSRCKIQSTTPELQSCDKVHSLRSINEEIMKEYARS